jgi:hypothetical protein
VRLDARGGQNVTQQQQQQQQHRPHSEYYGREQPGEQIE